MAMMSGAPSRVEGLADMCPSIVDSVIKQAHEPEMYFQGPPSESGRERLVCLGNALDDLGRVSALTRRAKSGGN